MALSLAVLISGTGSNLRAIQQAIDAGACDARVVAVISDRRSAAGLSFASALGIPTRVVALKNYETRAAWNRDLAAAVEAFAPDLVVLAGFMRIVDGTFVGSFGHRIINVHPALLPSFPGADGPSQAIAARVALSGCTVHIVDQGVDTGPILAQAAVRVRPDDTAETLHARIQVAEHQLLPRVINEIAAGRIVLSIPPAVRGGSEEDGAVFHSIPQPP